MLDLESLAQAGDFLGEGCSENTIPLFSFFMHIFITCPPFIIYYFVWSTVGKYYGSFSFATITTYN